MVALSAPAHTNGSVKRQSIARGCQPHSSILPHKLLMLAGGAHTRVEFPGGQVLLRGSLALRVIILTHDS